MIITVIGGGSWGSALARILGDNHHEVVIYENDLAIVNEINTYHTNKLKLPNGSLPLNITASSSLEDSVSKAEIIVIAVPTKVIRSVLQKLNKCLDHQVIFVNASKGLEPDTFLRISEIVKQEINQHY